MFTSKYSYSNPVLSWCLSILFCTLCNHLCAQDNLSTDELFQVARKAAFEEKDYSKAKVYCTEILSIDPHYTDAKVFLGRLYSWNKQYDSARINFQDALNEKADYADASMAYADVEYWTGNSNKALQIINNALAYHPQSEDLLIRKAKVLNALQQYKEANKIVNEILQKDKTNEEARTLALILKDKSALNRIGISYDYVYFDKQFANPWHLISLDYTRQTKAAGITGRINYANRFGKNGLQYEAEAYPRLSKTFYAYTEIGYSDNTDVFPQWRGSFSLYSNLPKRFELELGWRYLYFSSSTNIFTGTLSKYYKNYFFGLRTYLTPSNNNISESYNAFVRYYFRRTDNFIGLTIGTGISPDERSLVLQLNNNNKLQTYRTTLEYRHIINTFNVISLNASLINQEYLPKTKGNQIQAGLRYQRRF